jgi:hypothetical protein
VSIQERDNLPHGRAWLLGSPADADSAVKFTHYLASAMLLLEKTVNVSNPFQIPSCLQKVDFQQRRRERFKNGFIAAVAAMVILLVGLLIEGCKTEQATSTTTPTSLGAAPPQANQPLVAGSKVKSRSAAEF